MAFKDPLQLKRFYDNNGTLTQKLSVQQQSNYNQDTEVRKICIQNYDITVLL